MIKTAYCKINLTLEILGTKRGDGFHDLKSVMHKIPLGDVIKIELTQGEGNLFLDCNEDVCENQNNLAYLAAKAYVDEYRKNKEITCDIYITLTKVTPTGAGLGGGSADAACVLDMLSRLLCGVDDKTVTEIASRLGSDIVFCLEKYKCAFCTGRGEICENIDVLPKNTSIVIAKPNESLNTKGIYKSYDERYGDDYSKCGSEKMRHALKACDKTGIKESFVNDFEALCIERLPEIGVVKEKIASFGAYVSAMSGSGSAVFGLFDDEEKCLECKKMLCDMGLSEVFAFTPKDFEKMYKGE